MTDRAKAHERAFALRAITYGGRSTRYADGQEYSRGYLFRAGGPVRGVYRLAQPQEDLPRFLDRLRGHIVCTGTSRSAPATSAVADRAALSASSLFETCSESLIRSRTTSQPWSARAYPFFFGSPFVGLSSK